MATTSSPATTSTEAGTTTLFLSFSGLLTALCEQRITPEELKEALFYFGCSRELVFEFRGATDFDAAVENMVIDGHTEARAIELTEIAFQHIRSAIQRAEGDGAGRVVWRERAGHNTIEQLNGLLEANGLPAIAYDLPDYSYPEVKLAVAAQGLPLRVFTVQ